MPKRLILLSENSNKIFCIMQNKSNFFNEFSDKSSCQNSGMCSIDPSSYALEELLLNEIKQTAFYIVKLEEFDALNNTREDIQNIINAAIKALTVIIVNTAIRMEDYTGLLYSLEENKTKIKEEYLNCCKTRKIKYELVENAQKLPKNPNLTNLLKAGEAIVIEKRKEYEPKKLNLIELIIIFAKTSAINIEKLHHLGYQDPQLNFEILKFLNLTNIATLKRDKLKKKICDFSSISFEIWKKLIEKTENKYGKRKDAEINLEIKPGKSILVTGSDLDELEKLLDAVEGENINIYTNSTLFMAFAYPHFSKYKNLIGHFGGENPQTDFTNFKGPIFATQNFLQKVDYFRRGIIYTTKIIAPEKMVRIENYDFTPLIENANKSDGFTENDAKTGEKITLKYDKNKIDETLKACEGKDLCIIVGSYKKEEIMKRFTNCTLVQLESPVEIQLLIYILENAKPQNLNLVFTHCGPNTINIMLGTLFKDPKKSILQNAQIL